MSHARTCRCDDCWRHRRSCLRRRHILGSLSDGARVGVVTRPEYPIRFALPSAKSGLLLAIGGVGALVIANRIQREHDNGKGLAEQVDGIIAGMVMYATLEHLRVIHRAEAGKE